MLEAYLKEKRIALKPVYILDPAMDNGQWWG